MAKSDSPGLLSKVVRFVRNPLKDWSEFDRKEPAPESGYSKEALKEMIERKRQNDFVRKREFDQLRKMRRREPLVNSDQAGRPSFFQSSLPSNPDERAMTLRKIDEIEAQMSRQWWKGRQDEASARASNFSVPARTPTSAGMLIPVPPQAEDDSKFKQTEASAYRTSLRWMESGGEFSSTQMDQAGTTVSGAIHLAQSGAQPLGRSPAASGGAATVGTPSAHAQIVGAGFSTSKLFAVELGDSLTDPDLEEAAIRFANGDDAGAEASLLSALQGDNVRLDLAETWLAALFDLYRATGQQARFESVAIDFAARFGRSAPAWFSTPDLLGRHAAVPVRAPLMARHGPTWSSPAEFSVQSLAALLEDLKKRVSPLHLDWRAIVSLAPDAADGLGQLFASWCVQPVELCFRGYENLERALRTITPSGDKRVSPSNWQLRMDALRVMRLQDEFELVALEYCVTFEVSPPSWQDARCVCELEWQGASSGQTDSGLRDNASVGWGDSGPALAAPMGLESSRAAQVELSGEIVGDAADVLGKLETGLDGASRLVISCAKLIRVDFSAAGSILNWVIKREEEGCQVQFRDVNRIVAAFFNVIGINEHAKVVPRSG